eukprot:TRINITY_DN31795_c0_g1_i1.p1 TRINITY_DN31795_c0_g1~~TRINITY_DN31795_c0_g1_i1.p1  ORF type:complete len:508 (+),score=71.08 TRINITY_DN31795_c0_g1_i1:77-1525(+)
MAKCLQIPSVVHNEGFSFETYKQCPSMILEQSNFQLPEYSSGSGCSPISSADAEAYARGAISSLIPLFKGQFVATALGSDVAVVSMQEGQPAAVQPTRLACGARVASLVPISGEASAISMRRQVLLLASTCEGGLILMSVSCDGRIRLLRRAKVNSAGGSQNAIFVSAAAEISGGAWVLAHRAVKSSEGGKARIEVLALRLEFPLEETCPLQQDPVEIQPLCVAEGVHSPVGAYWYGEQALLVAQSAFHVTRVTKALPSEDVDMEPSGSEVCSSEGCGVVLTVLQLGCADVDPSTSCWVLDTGELLAAWPSEADRSLLIALSGGDRFRDALILRTVLPSLAHAEPDAIPQLMALGLVPAMASCAAARPQLRLLSVSPNQSFVALVENKGQNAVSVFRNRTGEVRLPTAAPSFNGLQDAEVSAISLLDSELYIRTSHHIVRCKLDASVKVDGAAPKLMVSQDKMPLGVDPQALLRMLDMHGED